MQAVGSKRASPPRPVKLLSVSDRNQIWPLRILRLADLRQYYEDTGWCREVDFSSCPLAKHYYGVRRKLHRMPGSVLTTGETMSHNLKTLGAAGRRRLCAHLHTETTIAKRRKPRLRVV
jgi:hypothetical protein